MNEPIEASVADINRVFNENATAAQQLQIVTLTRVVGERDERIASLEEENKDLKDQLKKKT
tara:strand:+ start:423 stop:605 length:183 start_codon:yes stop_codon:yes gene_type:complete